MMTPLYVNKVEEKDRAENADISEMSCIRILLCMCNTHRDLEMRAGYIFARETNMSHMMNVVKENRAMPK